MKDLNRADRKDFISILKMIMKEIESADRIADANISIKYDVTEEPVTTDSIKVHRLNGIDITVICRIEG